MTKPTPALPSAFKNMMVPGRAHDIFLVTLIALRPLIWSGDASAWDNLAWLALTMVALTWLVIDAWRGRLPAWHIGLGGVLGATLLLSLLPAALGSPYPSTGLSLWGMAVIHLGFSAYLMQVINGRERLAFAAFAGALTIECVLALGQWIWVFPGMALALSTGDPTVSALENANGDLAERIANGGLFGTFTLANTLAAFLLLAAVPVLGVALKSRGIQRFISAMALVIALVVACGTASKGAAVAFFLSAMVIWTMHRRGHQRWLALMVLLVVATAIAVIPPLRQLGAASVAVRLDYWQGAQTLIAEAPLLGHGIHGFSAASSRAMPITAEPTRHVHNDVLEAAVDGGIISGILLMLFLLYCARPRRDSIENDHEVIIPNQDHQQKRRFFQAAWPLLIIVPFFTALGMLMSSLEWWPLGADEATWWLWPLIMSAILVGVIVFSARLPLPPAWAWQLALVAFAGHCLVDFNLQSPAIWGTLIVVTVLAGGHRYAITDTRSCRIFMTLSTLALVLGFAFAVQRLGDIHHGKNLLSRTALTTHSVASFHPHSEKVLTIAEQWPASVELVNACIMANPPGSERLSLTRTAVEHSPWNAQAHEWLAQDLALAGRWDDAINALKNAINLNPGYLPRRQHLAELLDYAANTLPTRANDFHRQAESERQHIAELSPIVHPRNRLIIKPGSTLPVQPAAQ